MGWYMYRVVPPLALRRGRRLGFGNPAPVVRDRRDKRIILYQNADSLLRNPFRSRLHGPRNWLLARAQMPKLPLLRRPLCPVLFVGVP
jgi:hypothetical protein